MEGKKVTVHSVKSAPPVRRSSRLREKGAVEESTKVLVSAPRHSQTLPPSTATSSFKGFPLRNDDTMGMGMGGKSAGLQTNTSTTSKTTSRSSRRTTKKEQKRLEIEMRKKELEHKHRQEMMDLQLAMELAQIEEETDDSSSESRETIESKSVCDIEAWNNGKIPWNNGKKDSDVVSQVNSSHFISDTSQNHHTELVPQTYCVDSTLITKMLARQSMAKDLPIFTGDPSEWPNFICEFKNSTSVCGFSLQENLSRLQRALQGPARKVVRSLLVLPQNVNKIIDTLENRFGRSEIIVLNVLEQIKNLPDLKPNQHEQFVNFSDEIKNAIGILENLDQQDYLNNPILLKEILQKLPQNLQISWVESISGKTQKKPKLLEFVDWLDKKSNNICQVVTQNSKFDKSKFKSHNQKDVTLTTQHNNDNHNNKVTKKCFCCEEGSVHPLSSCSKFKGMNVDERWSFITSKRACFSCLSPGHGIKQCKRVKKCGITDCPKPHHQLLHNETGINKQEKVETVEINCHIKTESRVLLKILPIVLRKGDKFVETYALLDDASTVTLIDEELANILELEGPHVSLSIQWTNNQVKTQSDSRMVSCDISALESDKTFKLRHIRTMRGLSLPSQTVNMTEISSKYPYVSNHPIKSMTNAKPKLLIGQDNWPLIVNRKMVTGPWNSPALSKTLLGWTIHGNVSSTRPHQGNLNNPSEYNSVCLISSCETQKDDLDMLHDLVKEQWKLDNFGLEQMTRSLSKEDARAQKILDDTMRRVGDRFETGLLWKDENIVLPESYDHAFNRLKGIERKIDKNPEFGRLYCEKMDDMEKKGYLVKLDEAESQEKTPKTWYLCHFGVTNPNKPGKLRVVFDAASASNGVRLNDCLLTGPDLYNSLYDILLNFRLKKFAFAGDIQEMFLRVLIRKEDRCAQRILWRGMERSKPPQVYEIAVVFFGSTCGPCLAQEAKDRNAREFIGEYPKAVNAILNSTYMDDFLGNADTEDEGIQLINDVIEIHKKGGFLIRNWITNSQKILSGIDDTLKAESMKRFDENNDEKQTERILGAWWNHKDDVFLFDTKFHKIRKGLIENKERPTKRDVLKIVMSIFDPLGFLTNFLIQGKILLQDIWRNNIGWDDEIPDTLNERWILWLNDLKMIFQFRIPRQYFTLEREKSQIQLHIFTDASDKAYATVAYLRVQQGEHTQVSFVTSKARVTSLKPISIPRAELQGALMGARLGTHLRNTITLNITNVFFWTDSKTVLYWIRSEAGRFKVFVAQRLGEIQDLTNTTQWKYVPSKENPADLATKRKELEFSEDSIWLFGPKFLYKEMIDWPKEKPSKQEEHEIDQLELKNETTFVTTERQSLEIPDPNHFSFWYRFKRSTAWFLRFIRNIQTQKLQIDKTKGPLTVEELEEAETLICRKAQEDSFLEEIDTLKKNKPLKKSSRIFRLSPVLDKDGILRIGGRLDLIQNRDEDFKRPVILDPKHPVTILLINGYHNLCFHQGHETVIYKLREKFWILHARQAVKKAFKNCQKCKNKKSVPEPPIMGQLPLCRLEPTVRPFIKTGIDYFGPIKVSVKRSTEKRYGVLFTCMVTRAVHLEIAQDLSTSCFIHVLRQFICRRGPPEELYSDNGKNFVGANKELKTAISELNKTEITDFCCLKNIKWNFNPPLAPNMGGVWERLIKTTKKILNELLTSRSPQEYVLRTLFAEAENMINSRPLTHVSLDSEDMEPLTPNHFLIGPSYLALPCSKTVPSDLHLMSKWKAAQRLADYFWQRWLTEYMPFLVCRSKWHMESKAVTEGDIVVVVDPDGPRNTWPKGRIIRTYPGKDKKIRSVEVKLANGHILKRPVTKICILDVKK